VDKVEVAGSLPEVVPGASDVVVPKDESSAGDVLVGNVEVSVEVDASKISIAPPSGFRIQM